jgi:multiple sugar transport system ATP-binding protein
MAAVVLNRVSKVYKGGVRAVDDLYLEVLEGEVLVLLGPSGCGKTTILRIIAGLEEMTDGDLWLNGDLANYTPTQRRNIAMVFQNGALYPKLTVQKNLAFPLKVAGITDKQAVASRVLEISSALGIEETLDRLPRMLSGGERQRVAIGRALIRGAPQVLLMDEPLASLDATLRVVLRGEIESLVKSSHQTTVYVTHDQIEAMALADRIAVIRHGKLQDIGTPAKVYADPATAFVAAFIGSPPINLVSASIWAEIGERIIIDLGPQRLYLPWSDPRSGSLAPYHGQTVIVGIRPDVLTPAKETTGDSVLHGRVHSLEYHGHEWLARLEVGLHLVDVNTVNARSPGDAGAAPTRGPAEQARHHGHRRASLLLRLDDPQGWTTGQEVGVLVDVSRVFVFDKDGQRVDKSVDG